MGNQPPVRRVQVVTYEEPIPPPSEPIVDVDVSVNQYGEVVETETIVVPEPQPYVEPVVVETFVEPEMSPFEEMSPCVETEVQSYYAMENRYEPYAPAPVVVEEYYRHEPEVEVTTYSYGNPDAYVEYSDEPYIESYTETYTESYSDDDDPYP